ncbi:putative rRNA large subunit m3Psi methyltransferase RlmH [Porphyromonas catoniae F0037]|uniref:Ribosomal RNA large subunit methyltransferase H n=1 Tax=Porphyromonas catoniae F0037 TaxID=1127696 RepID=L1NH60_9PORP|nr:23S rRNA (pseudouridine(1915)-N(3))-methyltransferase RlmH [Porphyromonas catoniae]EKY02723.1 putative rRNA large subunit m3Psi methyltransferase RlmH [Porphyromonas catoniae F0037]
MQLSLLVLGKTDSAQIETEIKRYESRLKHYLPFELRVIPDVRRGSKLTPEEQKRAEGIELLRYITPTDRVYLFDERGESYTSRAFATFIERVMVSGERRLVFIIGGPYGFSPEVYERADGQVSLSRMTFSHQMVRLFAIEQLYRAQTIIRGEPYHHD